MARVVLAMSGGVDSSVAAWLLREQGHDVIGLMMRHGQALAAACETPAGARTRRKQGCCTAADAADARRVADVLGIPFYVVNFEAEFGRIVDYFVESYTAGRTPNPCIVCNTWLKFGKLVEYADTVGADYVATGHYARLVSGYPTTTPLSPCGRGAGGEGSEIALCRGVDAAKDQSYVLFGIRRELLPRLMFPVGEHRKEEIRRIAARLGLRVADKRDSQEICFVPDQDHARFVQQRRGNVDTSGELVTTDGTVVGRHEGIEHFTVGQRKGLRVAFGQRRYVVRIEPDTHRVVIGTREELARTELTACEANWLLNEFSRFGDGTGWTVGNALRGVPGSEVAVSTAIPGTPRSAFPTGDRPRIVQPYLETGTQLVSASCQVKIRYRSRAAGATVTMLPGDRFHVALSEPRHGVAPGQAAVCYDGDRVLGGGWIE